MQTEGGLLFRGPSCIIHLTNFNVDHISD